MKHSCALIGNIYGLGVAGSGVTSDHPMGSEKFPELLVPHKANERIRMCLPNEAGIWIFGFN